MINPLPPDSMFGSEVSSEPITLRHLVYDVTGTVAQKARKRREKIKKFTEDFKEIREKMAKETVNYVTPRENNIENDLNSSTQLNGNDIKNGKIIFRDD
jgi:septation ring formation regulator EzrA